MPNVHIDNGSNQKKENENKILVIELEQISFGELSTTIAECLNKEVGRNTNTNSSETDNSQMSVRTEEKRESDSDFDPGNTLEEETDADSPGHLQDQNQQEFRQKSSVGLNVSILDNVPGKLLENREEIYVSASSSGPKNYACPFCFKLVKKLPRHLESVHKDEEEIRKIRSIPKKRMERKQLLTKLRKEGRYHFNYRASANEEFQVARRPSIRKPTKTISKFTPCPNCKEVLNQAYLRQHFAKCSGRSNLHSHSIQRMSRRMFMNIHERANERLKVVLSAMKNDQVCAIVRYDPLLILFGNQQCLKYRHSRHLDKMIRAKLRLLGNFLIVLKGLDNSISQLSDVFDSLHYEVFHKAVNIIGKYNDETDLFDTPANASTLGMLIKELAKIWDDECTMVKDMEGLQRLEFFRKLFTSRFSALVSKTVSESQAEMQRTKKIVLPDKDDIKKLSIFLCERRVEAFNKIKTNGYDFTTWRILLETTLLSIQIFNRRRAGEIERLKLEHYNNRERINCMTNTDLFRSLSVQGKELINKYSRILLRGKKNRTVPILIDKNMENCIELILEYRTAARVHSKSSYLFGLPGNDGQVERWANACVLMAKYSSLCNAKMPNNLRGTLLRKHVATVCLALNLSDNEVEDLANFMGHHKEIHLRHYRQPVAARDILQVSRLLERAQGIFDETNTTFEETDDEEEPGNVQNQCINTTPLQRKIDENSENSHVSNSSGCHKKLPWDQESIEIVTREFDKELHNTTSSISGQKILNLINSTPCMKSRTPAQVRTWLHNRRRRVLIDEDTSPKNSKRNTVPGVIYRLFEKHVESNIVPTIEECIMAYHQSPSLKMYSPANLQELVRKAIELRSRPLVPNL